MIDRRLIENLKTQFVHGSRVLFRIMLWCFYLAYCHGTVFSMVVEDETETSMPTEQAFLGDHENEILFEEFIKEEICAILTYNPTPNHLKLIENLSKAFNRKRPKSSELVILQDILEMLHTAPLDEKERANFLADILKGAHVHVIDEGAFYAKWSQMNAKARISSHRSKIDSIQYGISGPWIHEILFGVVDYEDADATFFQLENSPYGREIINSIKHIMDYLKYKVRGKNQGPYGESEHKDNNPIFLNMDDEGIQTR